jgi:hypothetical protein
MRTGNLLSGMAVIVAAIAWLLLSQQGREGHEGRPDEIEYQGQHFRLSKAYADYSDYKNDPDNIDPSENARVERAVADAKVGTRFASAEDMATAVGEIQFPGYGMSGFSGQAQSDGSTLEGFSVEIPRAGKDRVLVFRGSNGRYSLVDDFVVSSDQGIMEVREKAGQLLYKTFDGRSATSSQLSSR